MCTAGSPRYVSNAEKLNTKAQPPRTLLRGTPVAGELAGGPWLLPERRLLPAPSADLASGLTPPPCAVSAPCSCKCAASSAVRVFYMKWTVLGLTLSEVFFASAPSCGDTCRALVCSLCAIVPAFPSRRATSSSYTILQFPWDVWGAVSWLGQWTAVPDFAKCCRGRPRWPSPLSGVCGSSRRLSTDTSDAPAPLQV